MSVEQPALEQHRSFDTTSPRTCPECDGDVRSDGGEDVCADCGLVVAVDDLDRGPEWRSFPDSDVNGFRRAGGQPLSPLMHDDGLGSEVGLGEPSRRTVGDRQIKRLQRWNRRTRSGTRRDQNVGYVNGEIQRICSCLGYGQAVQERAAMLFRQMHSADLLPGRNLDRAAGVAVLLALRDFNIAEQPGRIAGFVRDSDDIARKFLLRMLKLVQRELGIHSAPCRPGQYVHEFCSELGLDSHTEHVASEMAKELYDSGYASGKSPSGLAAACVYAADRIGRGDVAQLDVTEVADCSAVTIREHYPEALAVYEEGIDA